jgi:hypothetical protein
MRQRIHDDDDDDDPYEHEFDSDDDDERLESDYDSDNEDTTAPCQYCGAAMYDDVERCPSCGNYQSAEDAPSRFPVWIKIAAVISLVIVVMWVLSML